MVSFTNIQIDREQPRFRKVAMGDTVYEFPSDMSEKEISEILDKEFAKKKTNSSRAVVIPKGKEKIADTIRTAAEVVGLDPELLLAIAKTENNKLDPEIKAKGSSATGLFQFIKRTWADTVKKFGEKHNVGLEDIKDPYANAIMGAEFTKANREAMEKVLGRPATLEETYFAHFSGLTGAKRVLRRIQANPDVGAAEAWGRAAAKANPSLFKAGAKAADVLAELTRRVTSNANRSPEGLSKDISKLPLLDTEGADIIDEFLSKKPPIEETPIFEPNTQVEENVAEKPTEEPTKDTPMTPGFFQREDGTFFELTPDLEIIEHGS